MGIIYTGFHAIEERVRLAQSQPALAAAMHLHYAKPGPRIKKIIAEARRLGIDCSPADGKELDTLVRHLPETARDHRGLVLCMDGGAAAPGATAGAAPDEPDALHAGTGPVRGFTLESWLENSRLTERSHTVVVLDSVTDPHNVGAIIRSCDQFGASLVILPERRGVSDVAGNDVIARSSAGANAWVPVCVVKNLVRAVQLLKAAGFWVYGADAGGTSVQEVQFQSNKVIVMGSEGTGISRLLESECDTIVSIPTCGKIDSLNVSVAAGVFLYEIYRQQLQP